MAEAESILIEPWMQHYREELRKLQDGKAHIEMRGHIYSLCHDCRRVVKISGWFGGTHLCR